MGTMLRVVGESVQRADAFEKVTGAARYGVDISWPGTLHGVVVRAQRAAADIDNIDATDALTVPGVRAVVTAADLDGLFPRFGHHFPDHDILAMKTVRYWGEPVAVVVADTARIAHEAAELLDIRYRDLPAVMDISAALAPDAPLVHPDKPPAGDRFGPVTSGRANSNEAFVSTLGWGDIDDAFRSAELVVETRNVYPMLYAYAMEPYNAQARFLVDGSLEIVSTAQHPFQVQKDVARVFSLPLNKVRVSAPYLGGGFGSKSYTKIEPLTAVCSRAVGGRPVKIVLDVEGSIYTTRADGAVVVVKTAFDAGGMILGRDITIDLDTGAYADNSPQVLARCVSRCFGPYRMPALRVRGRGAYTNTAPASSYRGFGASHTNVASELNLSKAATLLGIDPVEIRLRNYLSRGDVVVPGKRPLDANLHDDLTVLQSLLRRTPTTKPTEARGVGIACAVSDAGANPLSTALVRLLADGSAILACGSAEMGQGSKTALAQIVAEELGIAFDAVHVVQSDTQLTPFQWTTGASRTTAIVGLSVQRACQSIGAQLVQWAAEASDAPADGLRWDAGRVVSDEQESRPAVELIQSRFGGVWGEVIGVGQTRRQDDIGLLPSFWEIGMVGVAVCVDLDTGKITVDQLASVADVGRAVNPEAIRGQELGAATQGMGAALFEELQYDGPQIVNANMIEYRIPRFKDMPSEFSSEIIERGDGIGPYGAKGMGEGALAPAASAIFAAVADAIGVWPEQGPLTPERVWRLLRDRTH